MCENQVIRKIKRLIDCKTEYSIWPKNKGRKNVFGQKIKLQISTEKGEIKQFSVFDSTFRRIFLFDLTITINII